MKNKQKRIRNHWYEPQSKLWTPERADARSDSVPTSRDGVSNQMLPSLARKRKRAFVSLASFRNQESGIRRKSIFFSSFCFLLFAFSFPLVHAAFNDIDVTHPYYHAINALQDEGIVEGYKKGDQAFFLPLQPVIRAEALKVLALSSDISTKTKSAGHFSDVPANSWYASYVNTAADLGIVEGFADGNFHPSAQVSRSEFLKMLVLSFHVPVEEENVSEEWYGRFFRATANLRILDDPNSSSYESVSRGEMAELIYRTEKVAASNFQKKYVFAASGKASFYGDDFAGRSTASGEKYDPTDLTAAHRTLPFGTFLKVSREGKSVVVRVNDRGPYKADRVLDLSEKAFSLLAPISKGVITVDFEVVSSPGEEKTEIPDYIRPQLSIQAKSAPLPSPVANKIAPSSSISLPKEITTIPIFSGTVSHLSSDFFPGAELRRSIPQKISLGTVISFAGTASESGHKKATVFLQNLEEGNMDPQIHFSGPVSGKNFSFPVFFSKPGKFYIGLVFDDESKSRVETVEVVQPEKERKFPAFDVGFSSDISARVLPENSEVTFQWSVPTYTLSRLDFEQGKNHWSEPQESSFWTPERVDARSDSAVPPMRDGVSDQMLPSLARKGKQASPSLASFSNKKTLFVEDGLSEITLPYNFFSSFSAGEFLKVTLSQSLSDDETLDRQTTNWRAVVSQNYELLEGFPDAGNPAVTVSNFSRFPKTLDPLVLEGTKQSGTKMKENAFVITPSGFVREFPVSIQGDSFVTRITLEGWGMYVIEFMSEAGEILFSRAVYASENFVLPVVPRLQTALTSETEAGVLYWINTIRHAHTMPSVVLSGEIGQFAQNYASQMAQENFISHTDPSGFSFDQRIKKFGLQGEFGENLSFGSSLRIALAGLENSASHRDNILRRKWTKVGIGLAQNAKGEWYVTQVFGK